MGGQAAQNWILLGGLLINLATLAFVVVYVRATKGIQKAAIEQTEESRKLGRWQREQWALDSKKGEWKEVIGTLEEAFQIMEVELSKGAPSNLFQQATEEAANRRKEVTQAQLNAARVIRKCLFITEVLDREKVMGEWKKTEALYGPTSVKEFQQTYMQFHEKLMAIAQADLGITPGEKNT